MLLKKLIEDYREKYHLWWLDLADTAETNRLHLLFLCPVLFAFGLIDLLVVVIMHFHSLGEHLYSIIYFSIFTVFSLFGYIYSRKVENVDREKAYIVKTMPFYVLFLMSVGTALYNFYILNQPFNGFLTLCITGLIALCIFSFSPFQFLFGLLIGVGGMSPVIYKTFGASGLADAILIVLLMFCFSLLKRREEKKYIRALKKQKRNLEAKTFGNFTLLFENKVINFSRTKSNELLGYLVYKYGSSVNTKELISVLWGDHADSARYGGSLRNLIIDVKRKLSELEIHNFFITEYNSFRINPEAVKCDYYDFLAGDTKAIKSFTGEFMSQYSWSEEAVGFLERKVLK